MIKRYVKILGIIISVRAAMACCMLYKNIFTKSRSSAGLGTIVTVFVISAFTMELCPSLSPWLQGGSRN
jgi:hypothetical protein